MNFDLFWDLVISTQQSLGLSDPVLPRQRKRPPRYEGTAQAFFPSDPKEFYKTIYFESLDAAVQTITDRFDQEDFNIYAKMEQVLILAAMKGNYNEELQTVLEFYQNDFCKSELESQLEILGQMNISKTGDKISFLDVRSHLKSLSASQLTYIQQVVNLAQLVLLMPATNAVSERSASAMRRIKTYLRTSMTQARLNNLMVVHVHKHLTDNISPAFILNEFVRGGEGRLSYFGTF